MTQPEIFVVSKDGLRYERSGDSIAIFNEYGRIARYDLPAATEAAFLKAVDEFSANLRTKQVA